METIFMNYENSKKNESNKFFYELTDKPRIKAKRNNEIIRKSKIRC